LQPNNFHACFRLHKSQTVGLLPIAYVECNELLYASR